jgi:hypothetical protein
LGEACKGVVRGVCGDGAWVVGQVGSRNAWIRCPSTECNGFSTLRSGIDYDRLPDGDYRDPGANMNRFLADSRTAGLAGGALRCACGLWGCVTMASVIVLAAPSPAQGATHDRPGPRERLAYPCGGAVSIGDIRKPNLCSEVFHELHGTIPEPAARSKKAPARGNRRAAAPEAPLRPPPPDPMDWPSPQPAPEVVEEVAPADRPLAPTPASPRPVTPDQGENSSARLRALQPLLLLGLLLPLVAAIGYPLRRRIFAVAGAGLPAPSQSRVDEDEQTVHFTYRPVIDPFALPVIGLNGLGAGSTARLITLAVLEDCVDTGLVVIPRQDVTAVFGLDEDALLDETIPELFIPGNLDAGLAYLETELAVRRDAGVSHSRRLLLIADCETETERIKALLARHPGQVSMIVLGDWPGEGITVDDDGLVMAPDSLANRFPERFPSISRADARERLDAVVLASQEREFARPPRRKRR